MSELVIEANLREKTGKGSARKSRANGRVPAVLYGKDIENLPIDLPYKDIEKVLQIKKINGIFKVKVSGKEYDVVIKDFQRHPLTRNIIHVDLLSVYPPRRVRVKVPVELVGTPEGVREGGTLYQSKWALKVRCMSDKIPEVIKVDVSHLKIKDMVQVDDIREQYPDIYIEDHGSVVIAYVSR